MLNKKSLQSEMAVLLSMQEIVGAYEEIAAMRMRKVKKSVLQNRDFLSGLNNLYNRVWYTYLHEKRVNAIGIPIKRPESIFVGNGKTVSVLVSANTRLYGDIIKKTFDLFLKSINDVDTDIVVIGKLGRQFMSESGLNREYKAFDIPDTAYEREDMKDVLDYILAYTNVIVYHGLYVSVLTQKPTKTLVTGQALDLKEGDAKDELRCLIEPSTEEVAQFFEKQILASVFEQSMFESSLSKYASRMISLDMASDNILNYLKAARYQTVKLRHLVNNIKQTERISGIALWD